MTLLNIKWFYKNILENKATLGCLFVFVALFLLLFLCIFPMFPVGASHMSAIQVYGKSVSEVLQITSVSALPSVALLICLLLLFICMPFEAIRKRHLWFIMLLYVICLLLDVIPLVHSNVTVYINITFLIVVGVWVVRSLLTVSSSRTFGLVVQKPSYTDKKELSRDKKELSGDNLKDWLEQPDSFEFIGDCNLSALFFENCKSFHKKGLRGAAIIGPRGVGKSRHIDLLANRGQAILIRISVSELYEVSSGKTNVIVEGILTAIRRELRKHYFYPQTYGLEFGLSGVLGGYLGLSKFFAPPLIELLKSLDTQLKDDSRLVGVILEDIDRIDRKSASTIFLAVELLYPSVQFYQNLHFYYVGRDKEMFGEMYREEFDLCYFDITEADQIKLLGFAGFHIFDWEKGMQALNARNTFSGHREDIWFFFVFMFVHWKEIALRENFRTYKQWLLTLKRDKSFLPTCPDIFPGKSCVKPTSLLDFISERLTLLWLSLLPIGGRLSICHLPYLQKCFLDARHSVMNDKMPSVSLYNDPVCAGFLDSNLLPPYVVSALKELDRRSELLASNDFKGLFSNMPHLKAYDLTFLLPFSLWMPYTLQMKPYPTMLQDFRNSIVRDLAFRLEMNGSRDVIGCTVDYFYEEYHRLLEICDAREKNDRLSSYYAALAPIILEAHFRICNDLGLQYCIQKIEDLQVDSADVRSQSSFKWWVYFKWILERLDLSDQTAPKLMFCAKKTLDSVEDLLVMLNSDSKRKEDFQIMFKPSYGLSEYLHPRVLLHLFYNSPEFVLPESDPLSVLISAYERTCSGINIKAEIIDHKKFGQFRPGKNERMILSLDSSDSYRISILNASGFTTIAKSLADKEYNVVCYLSKTDKQTVKLKIGSFWVIYKLKQLWADTSKPYILEFGNTVRYTMADDLKLWLCLFYEIQDQMQPVGRNIIDDWLQWRYIRMHERGENNV